MRWLAIVFALLPVFAHGDQDKAGAWSVAVNGLQGRLIIAVNKPGETDPFLRIYLELRNVMNVLNDRVVGYNRKGFHPRVVDETGRIAPPPAGVAYDGFEVEPKPLVMPFDSTLSFRINGHGAGVMPGTRQMLDFGPEYVWVIPQDGHTYYLSATLDVPVGLGDRPPVESKLDLPAVLVPKP
jgi:hypothetical protein